MFRNSQLSIVDSSSCGFVFGLHTHFWPAFAQQANELN